MNMIEIDNHFVLRFASFISSDSSSKEKCEFKKT